MVLQSQIYHGFKKGPGYSQIKVRNRVVDLVDDAIQLPVWDVTYLEVGQHLLDFYDSPKNRCLILYEINL